MRNILEGKKTILFPFDITVKADLELFSQLHKADENHFMGRFSLAGMTPEEAQIYLINLFITKQIAVWVVQTKIGGNKSEKAGFVYLSDFTDFSVSINGIMNPKFAKGLYERLEKENSNTYTEDAFHAVLKFCFDTIKIERVETDMLASNKLARRLVEKIGFKKEGRLRKAFKFGGKFDDVLIYSIIKGDYSNGQVQRSENRNSSGASATATV